MYKFNINDMVKVKLTQHGIDILRRQHEEMYKQFTSLEFEFKLNVDEDGYKSFQLHDLIKRLGPYLSISQPLPFETEIIITKVEPIESGGNDDV